MKYVKKITNKFRQNNINNLVSPSTYPSALELLVNSELTSKQNDYRVAMTVSCQDSGYIPKVKNAGAFRKLEGKEYQVMHNGIFVERAGYYGEWMSEIIQKLKGHHEPQEEKAFHEVLKRVDSHSAMIELGSYWSYYSLWFNKSITNAFNICCEPDPKNLELGKRNALINKARNIHFLLAAAGSDHGSEIMFKPQEDARPPLPVPVNSIDGIIRDYKLENVGIVHMDVQGAELTAIEGARDSIRAGKIRFMFISTHHYSISGDSLMHEKCIKMIKGLGGHIVTEHAIHESFSGDGLIVASFTPRDNKFQIDISENRMQNNLFREYTVDLDILIKSYEEMRQRFVK